MAMWIKEAALCGDDAFITHYFQFVTALLLEHLHGCGESGRILIAAVRCPTAFVDEYRLARAIREHEAATGHTCRPNSDDDWYCDTGNGSECDWRYTLNVDHIARSLSMDR